MWCKNVLTCNRSNIQCKSRLKWCHVVMLLLETGSGNFLISVKTRIKKIKPRINENMKRWNEAMCSHLQQELGILYSVSLLPTPSSVFAEKSCWNRCFGQIYFWNILNFLKYPWRDILNSCYGRLFFSHNIIGSVIINEK